MAFGMALDNLGTKTVNQIMIKCFNDYPTVKLLSIFCSAQV